MPEITNVQILEQLHQHGAGSLRFIRAERDADWRLHLAATADMLPHFFSMDRTNYSRWLPVYLADMHQLADNALDVHQEFIQGNHLAGRSRDPFSQVWTDMALEQTVNLDSKTRGDKFINSRIDSNEASFWDPLKRLNLRTFASFSNKTQAKTTDERIVTVSADRDLFARLLVAAKSRDVDLRDVSSCELSSVPCSLAHNDGILRKCTKAHLLTELERCTEVLPRLPVEDDTMFTAHIIDGMAVVQAAKSAGARTFGELASKYFNIITAPLSWNNCNRVDVVFDHYDKPVSIKSGERERRGPSSGFEIKIAGPHTPIPNQWQKYINNPKNKANLEVFLSKKWTEMAYSNLMPGQ